MPDKKKEYSGYLIDETAAKKFHKGELYDAYNYMGCIYGGGDTAVFRVWAPKADAVYLTGEFNGWQPEKMEKSEGGIFEIETDNVKKFHSYKYIVEKGGVRIYKSDPYALHFERGGTNGKVYPMSEIKVDDAAYREYINQKDIYSSPMNIYEAHIGSWRRYPDGNFFGYRKFADEIADYLTKMHYTHLELMGVAEYPFDGSWGYQVTGYFAPTSRYGTPADFCYLVEKLHSKGIGIIIDWVPGHFPKDENGLAFFDGGPLYEPDNPLKMEHKEWGTMCFDYGRAEVQTFLCSNALMWLEKYHIDGLRVDAVASMLYLDYGRNEWQPNIYGGKENIEAVAFLQKLNTAVFSRYPKALMIAEESTSWPYVTKPVSVGGLGFNFKWNMGWMNDSLCYISSDTYFRGAMHNKMTFGITYAYSENFILPISHDEVVHGKRSLIEKMPGGYDLKFAGVRNYLMYMYAHPGRKLLFMGCEFSQFIEWDYQKELDWMLLDYPSHREQQDFVAKLNEIYKKYPPFWQVEDSYDGFKWLVVDDNTQNVFVFERLDKDGNIIIAVINFSPLKYNNYRFGASKGSYVTLLSSRVKSAGDAPKKYKTQKVHCHGSEYSLVMDIMPMSGVYLYKKAGAHRAQAEAKK